jgi:AcrR family transcriptional regulator
MRLRDDNKRKHITAVAARLFASEPFHKVRLEDVAAAAGVGKGTLYVYFDSKEDLYFSIIYDGFSEMIDRLRGPLRDTATPAKHRIRVVVTELVRFAYQHPNLFELMRVQGACKESAEWDEIRTELSGLIVATLRDGVAKGELCDEHPEVTATYIPSLVRSALLFGPRDISQGALTKHVIATLENGICCHAAVHQKD